MRKALLFVSLSLALLGAGCTASTNLDMNNAGVNVDGGIDLNDQN